MELTQHDGGFMEEAFALARAALAVQEVPVGCVFVYDSKIIATGRNTVNETHNATRHAEINCIDQLVDACNSGKLNLLDVAKGIQVYVTVEPCIMCMNSLYDLGVQRVFYGCKNDRFGGETVLDIAKIRATKTDISGGFRAEEAMDLLKNFYKGVNQNAPASKAKTRGKKTGS